MKKLTIGSAVYDDFDGIYFSYQSLRLNNQDILDDLDLVVIDNHPESKEGEATEHFCKQAGIRYIPYTDKTSTSVRNEIFKHSEASFSMSIDSHVLFEPLTIKKLLQFFDDNKESRDLYHGPMLYDGITGRPVSKMDPVWRDNMFGIWASDERGDDADGEPFEIEMHGLGMFACKTDAWLGFHKDFVGFGGEEGYIHQKFQKEGRTIWCLPFLRWVHRFQRPLGIQYECILEHRIKNYLIGHLELGLDPRAVIDHFTETFPKVNVRYIWEELSREPF